MTPSILSRDGCPLHYWLNGRSQWPLVVFTHGAGADHRMFEAQATALAEQYQVLLWDVRGHGLSRPNQAPFSVATAVADLLAILDEIGCAQAIFVGQSMGGNISQEIGFYHPQRVKALVVIGSACNTFPTTSLEKWILRLTPALLSLYPYETLKRQSAKMSALKPEVQAYLLETFNQHTKEAFNAIFLATVQCLHEEPGYRFAKPFLLTHGEKDGTGNIKKMAPVWAKQEPFCHYEVIPQAGHCANQDNPDFFNRLLLTFLASLSR